MTVPEFTIVIANSVFENNVNGGGATIANSRFSGNTAIEHGAGLRAPATSIAIGNSRFEATPSSASPAARSATPAARC